VTVLAVVILAPAVALGILAIPGEDKAAPAMDLALLLRLLLHSVIIQCCAVRALKAHPAGEPVVAGDQEAPQITRRPEVKFHQRAKPSCSVC